MTNVVRFPRKKAEPENQSVPEQTQPNVPHASESVQRNILHGILGAIYIVLVGLWVPIRFLLIANVVIQFFRMIINWHNGAFAALWPFALSFILLSVLTYIMATWKPKAP